MLTNTLPNDVKGTGLAESPWNYVESEFKFPN